MVAWNVNNCTALIAHSQTRNPLLHQIIICMRCQSYDLMLLSDHISLAAQLEVTQNCCEDGAGDHKPPKLYHAKNSTALTTRAKTSRPRKEEEPSPSALKESALSGSTRIWEPASSDTDVTKSKFRTRPKEEHLNGSLEVRTSGNTPGLGFVVDSMQCHSSH